MLLVNHAATRLIHYLKSTLGQGLYFPSDSNLSFKLIVIQIELVSLPLGAPLPGIAFFWVLALSLGRQRSKVWFPVPLLKLNIEQLPMQLVKLFGSPIF
jgi:hypothetical protein